MLFDLESCYLDLIASNLASDHDDWMIDVTNSSFYWNVWIKAFSFSIHDPSERSAGIPVVDPRSIIMA